MFLATFKEFEDVHFVPIFWKIEHGTWKMEAEFERLHHQSPQRYKGIIKITFLFHCNILAIHIHMGALLGPKSKILQS